MIETLSQPRTVSMAEEWFSVAYLEHFWIRWRFEAFISRTKYFPRERSKILEVGCGNCLWLKQLRSLNREFLLYGCDLDSRVLETVNDDSLHLWIYDITERKAELAESFDAIFLMDVLEHIEDDVAFLEAVRFHLRPGGRIILNVPAHSWLYSRYDEVNGHIRRYAPFELTFVVRKAGFNPLESMSWGFSLVPLVWLRKFTLRNLLQDDVIKSGFEPSNQFIESFLQILRRLEVASPIPPPFGTSILSVAERV